MAAYDPDQRKDREGAGLVAREQPVFRVLGDLFGIA